MNENYSKQLEQILEKPETGGKKLLLHSCCAPCSSYVLEYLRPFFQITVLYYNPNITKEKEYRRREAEQKRLILEFNKKGDAYPIRIVEADYDSQLFFDKVKGYEKCREGGERCAICFEMRLREAARWADRLQADYFCTTLTISPLKNARLINETGQKLETEYKIPFLPSDFKKKDGYKRSIALSKQYDLYRQDYCGCVYSEMERAADRSAGKVQTASEGCVSDCTT